MQYRLSDKEKQIIEQEFVYQEKMRESLADTVKKIFQSTMQIREWHHCLGMRMLMS